MWTLIRRELSNHLDPIQKEMLYSFFKKGIRREKSFVGKICLDIVLDCRICLKLLPPLTLAHFLNVRIFFSYILSPQLMNFSLFYFLIQYVVLTWFLAGKEVIVATHCFKNCFTVIAIIINMETVNIFRLSVVYRFSVLPSRLVSWLKVITMFS